MMYPVSQIIIRTVEFNTLFVNAVNAIKQIVKKDETRECEIINALLTVFPTNMIHNFSSTITIITIHAKNTTEC